jgi:hypothetical protein
LFSFLVHININIIGSIDSFRYFVDDNFQFGTSKI